MTWIIGKRGRKSSLSFHIYMYLDGVANVAASGIRVSRQCKADFLRTSRVSS